MNRVGLATVLLVVGISACHSSSGSKTSHDGGDGGGEGLGSEAGGAGQDTPEDVGGSSHDGMVGGALDAEDAVTAGSNDVGDGLGVPASEPDAAGATADSVEPADHNEADAQDTEDANQVPTVDVPLSLEAGINLIGPLDAAAETTDLTASVPDGADVVLADARDTAIVRDTADAPADAPLGPDARDARPIEAGVSEAGVDGGNGPCCGCLCRDPSWCCSKDTCVDTAGHAIGLAAEAGFFELAGGSYVSEGQTRASPIQRIWYSFQPAATTPANKPLAVFFNGGPGSATSAYLFSFNTAPYTFDPAVTGTASIAANPNSWTQFANLLYIDAPATGFSYPLALADGTQPSVGIDLDREAGGVLRVVVRFLDRHPLVRANPVIIVGESYGGTRAVLLFDHLFRYQSLTSSSAAYKDPDLYNDLVSHFAAVWPTANPATISPSQLATQFGYQVLVQPVVAGDAQWSLNAPDTSVCVTGYDAYQCNKSSGWTDQTALAASQHLTTMATLHQVLGVDPSTIDWLYASARKQAYGRDTGTMATTPEMSSTFGALTSADNYFVVLNSTVLGGYSTTSRTWHDSTLGVSFLDDLAYVSTFITNAKYDMVVWTPAIAPASRSFTGLVASAVLDSAPRTGITRPGSIDVTYVAGAIAGVTTREIRFPSYANGGHTVSLGDPANLLADVMQWYAAAPSVSASAQQVAPTAGAVAPKSIVPPAVAGSDQVRFLGP